MGKDSDFNEIYAIKFDDPLACKAGWSPLQKGRGANFGTYILLRCGTEILRFRPSAGTLLIILVLISVSVLGLMYLFLNSYVLIPVIILFSIMAAAGLYGFSWYLTPVVFDRNKKVFNRKRNGKDELSFGIIHAVQLISKYNEDSSSEGAAVGYYSFELNLVLENGSRVNVVSHGDKERMVSDAEEVSKFLGKPLWNAL